MLKLSVDDLAMVTEYASQFNDGSDPAVKYVECSRVIMDDLGGMSGIAAQLATSLEEETMGIDSSTIQIRKQVYGDNYFPPPKIRGIC